MGGAPARADRLGRDVFARGAPEGLRVVRKSAWQVELYDLISAYGIVRARGEPAVHIVSRRPVMTLEEALLRVERLLHATVDWSDIRSFLPDTQDPQFRQIGARFELRRNARAGAEGQAPAGAGEPLRAALYPRRMREVPDEIRAVEATLFAAEEPMTVDEIRAYVGIHADVAGALAELAEHYGGRGIELVERGKRWHFQTAPDLAHLLRRERHEARKLSRAAVETLALSPITSPSAAREIEAIRGSKYRRAH